MLKYEILTTTQRGVLPAVALFNQEMSGTTGIYQLKVDYFMRFLDFKAIDVDTLFEDENSEHWLNYYNALADLANEHDLIVYEHQFGIYLLQQDIQYDEYELYIFENNLIPLRLDSAKARKARKFGLKYAGSHLNNKPKIIAIQKPKKVKHPQPLWLRNHLWQQNLNAVAIRNANRRSLR